MSSAEDRLATALAATGARCAFGVPGGGANLDMVGAIQRAGGRFVLAHTEAAACIMAATYGYVGDSVAAAIVTRGPGIASAVNGAAQATLDRQPLVLVSDAVAARDRDRLAHQRLDQRAMMQPVTKWSTVLDDATAALAPEVAAAWPPGCVHLDQDPTAGSESPDRVPVGFGSTVPVPVLAERVSERVAGARRPVVVCGVGAVPWADSVRKVVDRFAAPVFTTYQAIGLVDTEAPHAAGLFTNGASERALIERADLIVLVGVDMVEPIPARWSYDAPVVSIAPTRTREPYVPSVVEVVGDVGALVGECLHGTHEWEPDAGAAHRERVRSALWSGEVDGLGPIVLADAVRGWVGERDDVSVTVDAGAHFMAIMPLVAAASPKRVLISNGLATMGYALPAAVGVALARPGERVLALVGDGGLGMSLAELETIARLDLPITVIVFNDASLSLIRIKQGAGHGGDDAVSYARSDFAAIAKAHGVDGWTVADRDDLARAMAAIDGTRPALIDARIDPTVYPHLMRVTRG